MYTKSTGSLLINFDPLIHYQLAIYYTKDLYWFSLLPHFCSLLLSPPLSHLKSWSFGLCL